MGTLKLVLTVVDVIAAVFLTAVIMLQSGKSAGLSGAIAGGADTVEYVIVAIVAVIIGAALIAFGNQMQKQMTKTGNSISSWFESARAAANTSINGVGK